MNFSIAGELQSPALKWFAAGLKRELIDNGYHYCKEPVNDIRFVLNFVDTSQLKPFRRKAQATFSVAIAETYELPHDILKSAYPILIRTLSNLLIYIIHTRDGQCNTYFITLEQGCYLVPFEQNNDELFFGKVMERLHPLASSRLVINNEFHHDLPSDLWDGDEITAQIHEAGKKLDALNLLPAPFPLEELLSPQDLRHVKRLYGIGGLSYGNLSARKDGQQFWMSGSGVNKGDMRIIGRDILLVMGYNAERTAMLLNVPPNSKPHRVSVDAIEHWMIYRQHPEVGAIVHVHAWINGIPSTEINYPCGTWELAQAVSDLVNRSEDPTRAIIGLKNHGLTITGPDLDDIFQRIEGRIVQQVPMT
ncbi:class II aldolase/adducin family protein [Paenibacillus dendritiformis]|uniref:class II aldolase/adducin family protein n=1 Tax=Paenibacillus dendritiformis TaxID=130049 RepID=UPI00248AF49F|nr:class II aldolase/adducin family protein [Paenibacillus dendritiformis]WGU96120.1 class II aldolase/adducin family protein [Paenibacillus dendritiformis]